jgi:hypothetical protein
VDWSNERYVRIYVRETVGDVALSWQARSIWKEILTKCDRAGVIGLGRHGVRGLAGLIRIPREIVEKYFQELLDDGRVRIQGQYLVVPNFIEAQEATQSDRQRAAESRSRRREKALLGEILSQNVTENHETNSGVTLSHNVSQDVTPCRTVLCRTVPNQPNLAKKRNARARSSYSVEFETFRSSYPKHRVGGKARDWKSWQVAKASGMTVAQADEYLEQWKKSPKWQRDNGSYIVALSRWLREGYWETIPADFEPRPETKAEAMRRRTVEALRQDQEDEERGLFD